MSDDGGVVKVDGETNEQKNPSSLSRNNNNENNTSSQNKTPVYNNNNDDDDADWPVRMVEMVVRKVGLLFGAYKLGASHPEWSSLVVRMLEFITTAWVTCLFILGLGWFRQRKLKQRREQEQTPQDEDRNICSTATIDNGKYVPVANYFSEDNRFTPKTPTKNEVQQQISDHVIESSSASVASVDPMSPQASISSSFPIMHHQQAVEHPDQSDFYIMDANSGRRVFCNTGTPFHISNEWFDMDMITMLRTSDVDNPDAVRGSSANDKVSEYMRNKQRRFEFQYQVKIKKEPSGKQLYFSCELNEPIKMGMITKAFVSAAMSFVRKTNPTFHYNITGSKERTSDGKFENPHMSFTVEGGLDRLVVTKPGKTPPELGKEIYEDPESIKKRKSGALIDWNTKDTYTMALWSSYVDFLDWRALNLPGIRPFSLSSVLGAQSINLTMYLIDEDRKDIDNHYRVDMTEAVKFELSNNTVSTAGTEALKWIKNEALRVQQQRGTSIKPSLTNSRRDRVYSEESEVSSSTQYKSARGDEDERCDSFEVDKSIAKINLNAEDFVDEIEEVDADDAAELGEGIYLRTGDSVIIKEFLSVDDKSSACSIINGGGFAVLARRDLPIVIEKTKRNKKNKLIKSGDTVMFSMIQSKAGTDETETRYLTIHRGWWLKWVTTMPSKNGFFTIFTHEYELNGKTYPTDEIQSSFLTLGGSFTLRHKRWSRFSIGITAEPSTDYGGRMLSLYNSKRSKETSVEEERLQLPYQSEDDGDYDKEMPSIGESGWIKPLVLCTQDPHSLTGISKKSPHKYVHTADTEVGKNEMHTKLVFSNENSQADVPAWIEMMNRVQRVRQLAYAVRVIHRNPLDEELAPQDEPFIRLKSGKELAYIMNIGQRVEIPLVTVKGVTPINSSSNFSGSSYSSVPVEITPGAAMNEKDSDGIIEKKATIDECTSIEASIEDQGLEYDNDNSIIEDDYTIDSLSDSSSSSDASKTSRKRKKKLRRKVKNVAKKAVVGTGRITAKTAKGTTKFAAKGFKETGKATGKVVKTTAKTLSSVTVARKSNKVPKMEPSRKIKNKDSKNKISKTMKKFGKFEAKFGGPSNFIAGELCATEQSRQTASRLLARMSNVPLQSSAWRTCNDALSSEISYMTDQDTWFLNGDAAHLGVKPSRNCTKRGRLLDESIVARCLWESHWREEWCGIYETCLLFYAPLAKSASHEIFHSDITAVRPFNDFSPLPSFPILVLETAWMCHYMAFKDEVSRDAFGKKVDTARLDQSNDDKQNALKVARFWQGFQMLSESSLSTRNLKWAKISSNQPKNRAILNGRRMSFDSVSMPLGNNFNKGYKFVEDLLTMALTFSSTTLEEDPDSFIDFLDMTGELRFLPLDDIDLSSPSAFCLFVNIYHCLLQQALLLSVNGPLHNKSIGHFMRTSCYEIGGDVFSLAELHNYVICGKMSPLINPKPPYVQAPKRSSVYRYYALGYTDVRVHFIINTADLSCPKAVPILNHRYVEQQLNAACVDFFCNKQLAVDSKRRTVTLPKVCEIHRNDFGNGNGEFSNILKFVSDEFDNDLGNLIRVVMRDEKKITVKFINRQDQYHSSLKLRTTASDQSLEMDYHGIQTFESTSM